MNYLLVGCGLYGVLLVVLGVAVGILAVSNIKIWIELKAMKQSTHKFTIFNPDKTEEGQTEFATLNKKLRETLDEQLGDLDNIQ